MSTNLLKTLACLALLSLWGAGPGWAQLYEKDTTFHLNVDFNVISSGQSITGLIEHPDGKLLIYGNFRTNLNHYSAARFFPNGQPDFSFMLPYGLGAYNLIRSLVSQPYGYFMVNMDWNMFKLSPAGQHLDTTFTSNIFNNLPVIGSVTGIPIHLPDGKYLVGCGACDYPAHNPDRILGLVRLLPSGLLDTTFTHELYPFTNHLMPYGANKILLGGGFSLYDGIPVNGMCRIDLEGNLDPTFQSIFSEGYPRALHVQPDGKIIVAGIFKVQGYSQELHFVRLNPDGSLDLTFNNFESGSVLTVCPTSDGGYLLGGNFTQYDAWPRGCIAKTDADGYLETAYFTGTGFDSAPQPPAWNTPLVSKIVRGSNDRYYVMGRFNGYNGEAVQPIIRLNGPQTVAVEEEVNTKPAVTISPNPAREYSTISWELPLLKGEALLVLTDLTGRELKRQAISGKQGQLVLDTRSLQSGIYLLQISKNGEQLAKGKVAVVK